MQGVVVVTKDRLLECAVPCKFSPLIGVDASAAHLSVLLEEFWDYIQRWVFRTGQENPDILRCLINN